MSESKMTLNEPSKSDPWAMIADTDQWKDYVDRLRNAAISQQSTSAIKSDYQVHFHDLRMLVNEVDRLRKMHQDLLNRHLEHDHDAKPKIKIFEIYRPNPPDHYVEGGYANPPDQVQLQGVEFADGMIVVRWMTEKRSCSLWASWDDFFAVHGHPEYGTKVIWYDVRTDPHLGAPDHQ